MSDHSPAAMSQLAAAHEASMVTMGFGNLKSFEFTYRTATMFSQSTMVPVDYQAITLKGYGSDAQWVDNPAAISNCMIALDMAQRMNANPLQVMQNLHVIEGRPSWSSAFIIAVINSCGHYSKLRFDLQWLGDTEVEYTTYEWVAPPGGGKKVRTPYTHKVTIQNARCVAWATERESGERLESDPITLEMAVKEGWYTKNGSKWPTMPEKMLRYRAASAFGKIYVPELLMGLPSVEETKDVIDVERQSDGSYSIPPAPPTAAAEPEQKMPRPPRARADAPAQPTAAPAAAPAQAATPPAAAQAPTVVNGVDQDTGEVVGTADTPPADLFEGMEGAGDAAQPEATPTPAPTAAPAAQPTAQEAKPAAGKPLSAPKVKFVQEQLGKDGTPTLEQFKAAFNITPDQLRDAQFPAVLEWLKNPQASGA